MIGICFGTRPEAIKIGACVAALRGRHLPLKIVSTGQHTDLLKGSPAETDLADSLSLGLRSTGDVIRWPLHATTLLRETLLGCDLVVVQGDTMSALAGARAAASLEIPLCHVEAGLRSGSLEDPFPEEGFRREITELATWHYAPTGHAAHQLLLEGVPRDAVVVTGNPVVSAIARYAAGKAQPADPLILFTMHRREWQLAGIHGALDGLIQSAAVYPDVRFLWPVHPAVKLSSGWTVDVPRNVLLCPPLGYRETIQTLRRSLGCATDSGGLQEESATLGIPCAVLRHRTDRPESVSAGIARVYPPTREGVVEGLRALCEEVMPREACPIYGTVAAADRIAAHIQQIYDCKTARTSSTLAR